MQMIRVLAIFGLLESVNLNPERNSFLSSVFARGELSADTMYLQKTKRRGRRTLRGVLDGFHYVVPTSGSFSKDKLPSPAEDRAAQGAFRSFPCPHANKAKITVVELAGKRRNKQVSLQKAEVVTVFYETRTCLILNVCG